MNNSSRKKPLGLTEWKYGQTKLDQKETKQKQNKNKTGKLINFCYFEKFSQNKQGCENSMLSIFSAVYDDAHNVVARQQDMLSRQISLQQLGENNSQGDHRSIFKVKKKSFL